MKIWKYTLDVTDVQTLWMPGNAEILSVQTQGDKVSMWVMCDPDGQPEVKRTFIICGTGQEVPPEAVSYLGTFQMHEGRLAFHVFSATAMS